MRSFFIAVSTLFFGGLLVTTAVTRTWYQKYDWVADKYFKNPQVIALCKAIEFNDVKELDRIIKGGANVNAKGKGNMTPLMWAFPDLKIECIRALLRNGADPNVIFFSDFGTGRKATMIGSSVTHLATRSKSIELFRLVFDHGGDPNLVQESVLGTSDTPIAILITHGFPNKKQRIQLLIDKGADLNKLAKGRTLPMRAASWGGQYDIALMLLKAGADPKIYAKNGAMKLTHVLVREESRAKRGNSKQQEDYKKLVDWLEEKGESLTEARTDLDRWASWVGSAKEKREKLDAEIAARKAREAREGKSE